MINYVKVVEGVFKEGLRVQKSLVMFHCLADIKSLDRAKGSDKKNRPGYPGPGIKKGPWVTLPRPLDIAWLTSHFESALMLVIRTLRVNLGLCTPLLPSYQKSR